MPSQPVFKVPRLVPVKRVPAKRVPMKRVPVRYLITVEELRDMNGKIRCLSRLFKHPRRMIPTLQPYITLLLASQHSFVKCAKVQYTEAGRAQIKPSLESMKHLEDIVIRVILQGEDPARAHLRVINELYPYSSDKESDDDTDDDDSNDVQTSLESPAKTITKQ
ncbi:hypothetical protein CAEBREN_18523 [Caenorhabditis brenneri]|uniref:Uncharacterized protein n=1 Tax=Caenorhabditis brenneri TaxID=135651 RepID=G0NDC0_CAEBE|nr:hypothetical protein CAEBREN_18523 [Caenorhabditis brenneri]